MLHRLRRKLPLPHVDPRVAIALLVAWGLSLVVVEYGVRIQAIMPVPLVSEFEDCDLRRQPPDDVVLVVLEPGTYTRLVSTRPAGAAATCYQLELADGRRGWAPWHPQYLQEGGGYLHMSPWLRRLVGR